MSGSLKTLRSRATKPEARARINVVVALISAALLVAFPAIVSPYALFQLAGVMAFAVAALGLNVITGYTGQVTLAHNAFFAVGAYSAAMSITYLHVNYMGSVLVAALMSFTVGILAGFPAQRLRGLYLSLVTLAIAVSVTPLIKQFASYTGGVVGFSVDRPTAPGWSNLTQDAWIYYMVLFVAAIAFFMTRNLLNGKVGRSFVGVKEGELAAASTGVDVSRHKVLAFGYGSMLAGVGGALANFSIGYIAPDSFALMLSIGFLASAVVGGVSTVWGAVIAGIFLQFVPSYASDISQALSGAIYGAILIVCLMVMPKGIVGTVSRFVADQRESSGTGSPIFTK